MTYRPEILNGPVYLGIDRSKPQNQFINVLIELMTVRSRIKEIPSLNYNWYETYLKLSKNLFEAIMKLDQTIIKLAPIAKNLQSNFNF